MLPPIGILIFSEINDHTHNGPSLILSLAISSRMHSSTRVREAMIGVRTVDTIGVILLFLGNKTEETATGNVVNSLYFEFISSSIQNWGDQSGIGADEGYFFSRFHDFHACIALGIEFRSWLDLEASE